MRSIIAIVLLVGAVAWFVYQPDGPIGYAVRPVTPQWRHTTNGWEKLPSFSNSILWDRTVGELSAMSPHPAILSLFVGMFSVLVLVASSPSCAAPSVEQRRVPSTTGAGEIELRSLEWLNGLSES